MGDAERGGFNSDDGGCALKVTSLGLRPVVRLHIVEKMVQHLCQQLMLRVRVIDLPAGVGGDGLIRQTIRSRDIPELVKRHEYAMNIPLPGGFRLLRGDLRGGERNVWHGVTP